MTPQQLNHPKKGSLITVEPIRSLADVAEVCDYLRRSPRNLVAFTLGVNTNLRAGDLLSLTMGDIDWFMGCVTIREEKTGKKRNIPLSPEMLTMLVGYCNPDRTYRQDELLFPSGKGAGQITVSSFNNMVKKWCKDCGLRGNFGSHTLRKTWAYLQYTVFKTDLATISQQLNHSSMNVTYAYLGITPEAVRAVYNNFIGGATRG